MWYENSNAIGWYASSIEDEDLSSDVQNDDKKDVLRDVLVVTLHGLIGTGKSYLCKKLCDASTSHPFHVWHYDYDKAVEAMSSTTNNADVKSYDVEAWRRTRERALDFVTNLIDGVPPSSPETFIRHVRSSSKRHVVLLDDNMYYRSMRYEFYSLCRQRHAAFAQLHVVASEKVAKKRNESRENPIPEQVCARLTSLCEFPDPKSNTWEMNTVVADSSESSKEIFRKLLLAWRNPPPPLPTEEELAELKSRLEAARAATLRNAVHVTDKVLRKRIGEIMRSAEGNKKRLAKELNLTRKSALDVLRKGNKKSDCDLSMCVSIALDTFNRKVPSFL